MLSSYSVEYIFLFIEIRYLTATQSSLTLIVLTGSKSFATTFNSNLTRSLEHVLCIIFCYRRLISKESRKKLKETVSPLKTHLTTQTTTIKHTY